MAGTESMGGIIFFSAYDVISASFSPGQGMLPVPIPKIMRESGDIMGTLSVAIFGALGFQMTLMKLDVGTAISAILLAISLGFKVFSIGGGYRGRTDDLLNAIQALYQTELIPRKSGPVENGW